MTSESVQALCPRCNVRLAEGTIQTAIWQGERLAVVEGIPAHVCRQCGDQYYDDDVSEALRRLSEEGFPTEAAQRIIQVPVFSLEGRIRSRTSLPEDSYVD